MEEKNFESELEGAKELLKELSSPDITLARSVEVYKEGLKKLQSFFRPSLYTLVRRGWMENLDGDM